MIADRQNSSLLSAILTWEQQKIHVIPVDKYKIFWSRQLPGAINSISMHQATVLEPHRQFELRHLVPGSTYCVQVQAISVFGQKRLRSKKASIALNTTSFYPMNSAPIASMSQLQVKSSPKQHLGPMIRLRFLLSKANDLVVKVYWNAANFS